MSKYNYRNLSPDEFEALALDIMQRILDCNLFRYGEGSDDGIDLCDNITSHNIVVQCKNYQQGSFSKLFNKLQNVEKYNLLSLDPPPKQYYVFTSLELVPRQKKKIVKLFQDYMKDESFIIDGIAINEFFRSEINHDLIEKNQNLFYSLPENYDREKYLNDCKFKNIIDSIAEKKESSNPFHYLNPEIEFRGRVNEYNALKRFLDERSTFLFWAITGPGGIGKSKLVAALMNEYRNDNNWKMVFLSNDDLEQVLEISEYRYSKNLLIVIDYAGLKAVKISKWIQKIVQCVFRNTSKLRILLLERLGYTTVKNPYLKTEENVAPEWFTKTITPASESIIVDKSEILKYKYSDPLYPDLLSLGNLGMSDYYSMMDDFVKNIKKEQKNESIDFLNNEQKKEIIKFINKRNHNSKQITPLYVLLLTYVAVKGNNFNDWSNNEEDILSAVYDRDFESWKKNFPEDDLRNSLLNILTYTTSVKEWIYGERLPDFLKQDEKVIAKYRRKYAHDPISDWNILLTGQQSNSETILISPVEPDIIGEYYVLRYFEKEFRINQESKHEWCALFGIHIEQSIGFIERCILDFGNSSSIGMLIEILKTINNDLHEQYENRADINKYEAKLYYTLKAFLLLWEQTRSVYREEAFDCLQTVLENWKYESVIAAEIYIDVFYRRNIKRGKRRKDLNNTIKSLHEKWPESNDITIVYIENLGELGKNYILSGTEKGKSKGFEIAQIIQKHYDTSQDKTVLEACVIALGKILTEAFQEDGINESLKKDLFESFFTKSLNDSDNAINSKIETCSKIVISQYNKKQCESDWKVPFRLFIDIFNNNKERNLYNEWRLGEVFLSLTKTLLPETKSEEVHELIDLLCALASDSIYEDGSTPICGGAAWHWRRIIERILEFNISDETINNKLLSMHKLLLNRDSL